MNDNKNTNNKNILIAAAWPYANGSLHLGHVAGLIGADILARYHRLKGDDVFYISGSDCYGTPIVVEAEKQGVSPKEVALKYDGEFRKTLIEGMGFSYDLFSKTTSPVHKEVVQEMFLDLYGKGYIYKKIQNLPYCGKCQRFLPDRYIEGVCPKCDFDNARGDQCDNCGDLLDPKELKDPKCKICGGSPTWKDSEHFFLKLSHFQKDLIDWVKKAKGWRLNANNFTARFLEGGLKDRAITRDSSWGIPIPLSGYEDKCIYVWFEAVCGYLSASKELALNINDKDSWKGYWKNNESIHYYVHGKDNIIFHSIIWPVILMGVGDLHLPDKILSSEYLNFKNRQFSKSRNWGVWLPEFLANYEADTLRYYLTVGGPENADGNFSWEDYYFRTNSELIGKFGNFVNRTLSFINKNFDGLVPERNEKHDVGQEKHILETCNNIFSEVGLLIEAGKFREAIRRIFLFIDECNKLINDNAPWVAIKTDKEKAGNVLNVCVQVISTLQIVLCPFLPFSSEKIKIMLNTKEKGGWIYHPIETGWKIAKDKPIFKKLEKKNIPS